MCLGSLLDLSKYGKGKGAVAAKLGSTLTHFSSGFVRERPDAPIPDFRRNSIESEASRTYSDTSMGPPNGQLGMNTNFTPKTTTVITVTTVTIVTIVTRELIQTPSMMVHHRTFKLSVRDGLIWGWFSIAKERKKCGNHAETTKVDLCFDFTLTFWTLTFNVHVNNLFSLFDT